jgi:hypothetical protein
VNRTTRARVRKLASETLTPAHVREIAQLALVEADRAQRVFGGVFSGLHALPVLLGDSRTPEHLRALGLRRIAARIIAAGLWKPYAPALRRALRMRAETMETTVGRSKRDVLALGLNEALHSGSVRAAEQATLPSALYATWLIGAATYRAENLLVNGQRRGRHAAAQRTATAQLSVSLDALLAQGGVPELGVEPLTELRREAQDRQETRYAEDHLAKLTPAQRAFVEHLLAQPRLPNAERDRQLGKRPGYAKVMYAAILRRLAG